MTRGVPVIVAAFGLTACNPSGADAITDPVAKAEYHCRYVVERAIADEAERDADGVLRREVADFPAPTVTRTGDQVRFVWARDSIARKDGRSRHGGTCVMDIKDGQQLVVSAELDGQPLHSGFRF
ncbi:hypothetical protein GCM10007859_24680 [Brevundimonas denitrificans]|uniref:Lipoprotein n=1 Tax=Brevundimonas denitrificans TaxID=1443434 RepID=A0ABQ6BLB7_9CAUL|nr:hypothetical protein [Brevundimonas denitrificans]GLS02444.1 hypothetical protein GCM10007859_24680 [Brevundimonas denitrificans]